MGGTTRWVVPVVILGMVLVSINYALITEKCIDCIREIQNTSENIVCEDDDGTARCGRYAISLEFYNACDIPSTAGWTWITCSLDDTCARWCIKKYMYNHETTCADDLGLNRTVLKCHDYGRIYAAGADACSDSTSGCDYEYAVRQVCYNYVPGDGTGSDHATRPDTENDCVV